MHTADLLQPETSLTRRQTLAAALLSVVFMLLTPAQAHADADGAPATPARKQWVLETIDGQSINLGERIASPDNRIMVFWATWCPYCKKLMPIVAQLKKDYPDLEVLSFNVFDDLAVEDYPAKANWPFIHLLNGDEFARAHGVKGLPTLFVLNGKGKMVLDLREIDTSSIPASADSNPKKAFHSKPLWNAGLRKALDQLEWADRVEH